MRDWNDLKYVQALHEGGTMKKAADLLATNATTVSRHIKQLSEDYGQMLFVQHKGQNWAITPAGQHLVRVAQSVNVGLSEVETGLPVDTASTLTITSLDFLLSYFLAPALPRLQAAMPSTLITLNGTDRRLSLAFNEADLALRFGRPKEGQLITRKISEVRFSVWRPFRGAHKDWVGMTEELDWTPDMQLAARVFGKPPAVRVSSYTAAKIAAKALGYSTVCPDLAMDDRDRTFFERSHWHEMREVWSVIHESRKLDTQLLELRECLTETFSTAAKELS